MSEWLVFVLAAALIMAGIYVILLITPRLAAKIDSKNNKTPENDDDGDENNNKHDG